MRNEAVVLHGLLSWLSCRDEDALLAAVADDKTVRQVLGVESQGIWVQDEGRGDWRSYGTVRLQKAQVPAMADRLRRHPERTLVTRENGRFWVCHLRGDALLLEVAGRAAPACPETAQARVVDHVTMIGRILEELLGRIRMMARLRDLVHRDPLTGALNYRGLCDAFRREAARAQRYGSPFSIAFFDLDQFGQVNKRHGHAVGDELLRLTARVLATASRGSDIVGRCGGDEFVLLMPETPKARASLAVQRILRTLARVQHPVPVTASAGLATYPQDGNTWRALLHAADRSMQRVKRWGRSAGIV